MTTKSEICSSHPWSHGGSWDLPVVLFTQRVHMYVNHALCHKQATVKSYKSSPTILHVNFNLVPTLPPITQFVIALVTKEWQWHSNYLLSENGKFKGVFSKQSVNQYHNDTTTITCIAPLDWYHVHNYDQLAVLTLS